MSGTSGGPAAISAAFVPGCILLAELASRILCSMAFSCSPDELNDGDLGPIWISVGGGGLGSRGELGGRDIEDGNSLQRFLRNKRLRRPGCLFRHERLNGDVCVLHTSRVS